MTEIKVDSVISFYPLDISEQDGEWIVGRTDIGSFLSLPEVGVEAIQLLQEGLTIQEAKEKLEQKYGEEVELEDFVETLREVGFVHKIDETIIEVEHEEIHAYLEGLKQEQAQILFSIPAYILYGVLMVIAAVILIGNPGFLPRFSDFMFTDSYTAVLLTTFVVGWILVFKHEFYHLAAAKSFGLDAQFRISHRLYFVVAETDITSVWTLPRNKRYRVYFAGIISDLVTISIFIIISWIFKENNYSVLRFFKTLILIQTISLVWQCLFFMQTDVYYIITNFFDCKNLFGDTTAYISNVLHRIFNIFSYNDLSVVPEREMRIIRIYSIFFVLGNFAALGILIFYILPEVVEFLLKVSEKATRSIDSITFLAILIINVVLLVRSIIRQRREA